MSGAAAEAARIYHLLESHPFASGRRSRIACKASSVFRGENARIRGLDPANVIAFAQPSTILFPEVNEQRGAAAGPRSSINCFKS